MHIGPIITLSNITSSTFTVLDKKNYHKCITMYPSPLPIPQYSHVSYPLIRNHHVFPSINKIFISQIKTLLFINKVFTYYSFLKKQLCMKPTGFLVVLDLQRQNIFISER